MVQRVLRMAKIMFQRLYRRMALAIADKSARVVLMSAAAGAIARGSASHAVIKYVFLHLIMFSAISDKWRRARRKAAHLNAWRSCVISCVIAKSLVKWAKIDQTSSKTIVIYMLHRGPAIASTHQNIDARR